MKSLPASGRCGDPAFSCLRGDPGLASCNQTVISTSRWDQTISSHVCIEIMKHAHVRKWVVLVKNLDVKISDGGEGLSLLYDKNSHLMAESYRQSKENLSRPRTCSLLEFELQPLGRCFKVVTFKSNWVQVFFSLTSVILDQIFQFKWDTI